MPLLSIYPSQSAERSPDRPVADPRDGFSLIELLGGDRIAGVQIAGSHGDALASAGEQVRITADGEIERGAISAQDPAWDWAEETSPVFAIHNRTLAEFLEWVARETGRQVVYASADAQRAAETLTLRGSIEGLDPDTALSAVLATTDLTRYESGDGLIGVRLAMSDD